MDNPEVTVCIATFNHAQYIARCLDSVIMQLLPGRIEVLVGDDCSTDDTRAIVTTYSQAFPDIVAPVFHQKQLGPSGNYRALIAAARGRYIAHLDGDDYWLPGKLTRQIAALDRSPSTPAVVANALVVDANDRPLGFFTSNRNRSIDLNYLLERGNFLCHGSLLYRAKLREAILEIEGTFIDYMILIKLARMGNLEFLREVLVVYRWNTAGSMRTTMTLLVGVNYWQAMLEALKLGATASAFHKSTARFLEKVFARSLLHGRIDVIIEWIRRVNRESPVSTKSAVTMALIRIPLSLARYLYRKAGTRLFRRISVLYPR
ncbi:MAG: glycosyltransferase [Gammaproteobacteria bacterium]